MTNHDKEIKYLEIMANEEDVKQLMQAQTVEAVQQVYHQYGLELSIEETREIMASFVEVAKDAKAEEAELSEEELVGVSGGGIALTTALGALKWTAGLAEETWGSKTNMVKQTAGFWKDVVKKGWKTAVKNNGHH